LSIQIMQTLFSNLFNYPLLTGCSTCTKRKTPFRHRQKEKKLSVRLLEKIDAIVYGLYGVTEEERGIIEGE